MNLNESHIGRKIIVSCTYASGTPYMETATLITPPVNGFENVNVKWSDGTLSFVHPSRVSLAE